MFFLVLACILLFSEHLLFFDNHQGYSSALATPHCILDNIGTFELTIWLSLLSFLLPIFFFYSIKSDEREEMNKVREQVAKDLHDDVGSAVSSIAILSELAMKNIKTCPDRSGEYLQKISNGVQVISSSMEEIIWNIKPDNDHLYDLEVRMRTFLADTLEPCNVTCTLHFDQNAKGLKLNPQIRRDLYLMYKECINNIAKYALASAVNIEVSQSCDKLKLTVCDNGIGMDMQKVSSGNGLGNLRSRAVENGGQAVISSKPNQGTKVIITIPASGTFARKWPSGLGIVYCTARYYINIIHQKGNKHGLFILPRTFFRASRIFNPIRLLSIHIHKNNPFC